jgi:hypothetical protein
VGLLLIAIVLFAPRGLSHGVAVLWSKIFRRGGRA